MDGDPNDTDCSKESCMNVRNNLKMFLARSQKQQHDLQNYSRLQAEFEVVRVKLVATESHAQEATHKFLEATNAKEIAEADLKQAQSNADLYRRKVLTLQEEADEAEKHKQQAIHWRDKYDSTSRLVEKLDANNTEVKESYKAAVAMLETATKRITTLEGHIERQKATNKDNSVKNRKLDKYLKSAIQVIDALASPTNLAKQPRNIKDLVDVFRRDDVRFFFNSEPWKGEDSSTSGEPSTSTRVKDPHARTLSDDEEEDDDEYIDEDDEDDEVIRELEKTMMASAESVSNGSPTKKPDVATQLRNLNAKRNAPRLVKAETVKNWPKKLVKPSEVDRHGIVNPRVVHSVSLPTCDYDAIAQAAVTTRSGRKRAQLLAAANAEAPTSSGAGTSSASASSSGTSIHGRKQISVREQQKEMMQKESVKERVARLKAEEAKKQQNNVDPVDNGTDFDAPFSLAPPPPPPQPASHETTSEPLKESAASKAAEEPIASKTTEPESVPISSPIKSSKPPTLDRQKGYNLSEESEGDEERPIRRRARSQSRNSQVASSSNAPKFVVSAATPHPTVHATTSRASTIKSSAPAPIAKPPVSSVKTQIKQPTLKLQKNHNLSEESEEEEEPVGRRTRTYSRASQAARSRSVSRSSESVKRSTRVAAVKKPTPSSSPSITTRSRSVSRRTTPTRTASTPRAASSTREQRARARSIARGDVEEEEEEQEIAIPIRTSSSSAKEETVGQMLRRNMKENERISRATKRAAAPPPIDAGPPPRVKKITTMAAPRKKETAPKKEMEPSQAGPSNVQKDNQLTAVIQDQQEEEAIQPEPPRRVSHATKSEAPAIPPEIVQDVPENPQISEGGDLARDLLGDLSLSSDSTTSKNHSIQEEENVEEKTAEREKEEEEEALKQSTSQQIEDLGLNLSFDDEDEQEPYRGYSPVFPTDPMVSEAPTPGTAQPVIEESAEQPVVEEMAEQPAIEASPQQPVIEEMAETPVTDDSSEQSVIEEMAEHPVIKESAQQPVVEASAQQPVIEEIAEQPVAKDCAPQSVIEERTEEPVAKESAEQSVIEESALQSVIEESAEQSVIEESAQQPLIEEMAEQHAIEDNSQQPIIEERTEHPISETSNQAPTEVETPSEKPTAETAQEPVPETVNPVDSPVLNQPPEPKESEPVIAANPLEPAPGPSTVHSPPEVPVVSKFSELPQFSESSDSVSLAIDEDVYEPVKRRRPVLKTTWRRTEKPPQSVKTVEKAKEAAHPESVVRIPAPEQPSSVVRAPVTQTGTKTPETPKPVPITSKVPPPTVEVQESLDVKAPEAPIPSEKSCELSKPASKESEFPQHPKPVVKTFEKRPSLTVDTSKSAPSTSSAVPIPPALSFAKRNQAPKSPKQMQMIKYGLDISSDSDDEEEPDRKIQSSSSSIPKQPIPNTVPEPDFLDDILSGARMPTKKIISPKKSVVPKPIPTKTPSVASSQGSTREAPNEDLASAAGMPAQKRVGVVKKTPAQPTKRAAPASADSESDNPRPAAKRVAAVRKPRVQLIDAQPVVKRRSASRPKTPTQPPNEPTASTSGDPPVMDQPTTSDATAEEKGGKKTSILIEPRRRGRTPKSEPKPNKPIGVKEVAEKNKEVSQKKAEKIANTGKATLRQALDLKVPVNELKRPLEEKGIVIGDSIHLSPSDAVDVMMDFLRQSSASDMWAVLKKQRVDGNLMSLTNSEEETFLNVSATLIEDDAKLLELFVERIIAEFARRDEIDAKQCGRLTRLFCHAVRFAQAEEDRKIEWMRRFVLVLFFKHEHQLVKSIAYCLISDVSETCRWFVEEIDEPTGFSIAFRTFMHKDPEQASVVNWLLNAKFQYAYIPAPTPESIKKAFVDAHKQFIESSDVNETSSMKTSVYLAKTGTPECLEVVFDHLKHRMTDLEKHLIEAHEKEKELKHRTVFSVPTVTTKMTGPEASTLHREFRWLKSMMLVMINNPHNSHYNAIMMALKHIAPQVVSLREVLLSSNLEQLVETLAVTPLQKAIENLSQIISDYTNFPLKATTLLPPTPATTPSAPAITLNRNLSEESVEG